MSQTVFATWDRSPFTWDVAAQKPLAFHSQRDAERANFWYRRWLPANRRRLPVASYSSENVCLLILK